MRSSSPLHLTLGCVAQGSARSRRTGAVTVKTVLLLRVTVNGKSPLYATEESVNDVFWNSSRSDSISRTVAESSFGTFLLDRRGSRAASVSIGSSDVSVATLPLLEQCLPFEVALLALDQVGKDLGIDAYEGYDFAVLFLPEAVNCGFAGQAVVGCDSKPCLSWYRTVSPITLMHELGHNLGLEHAGVDRADQRDPRARDEYGDRTTAMGHTETFGGYNAAEKAVLGWLPPASIWRGEVETEIPLTLRDFTDPANPTHGSSLAVAPRGDSGSYLLSFSDRSGIPEVAVHYVEVENGPSWLVTTLGPHGTFHGHGLIVEVDEFASRTATSAPHATVRLIDAEFDADEWGEASTETEPPAVVDWHACEETAGPPPPWCAIAPKATLCTASHVDLTLATSECEAHGAGARLCTADEVAALPIAPCTEESDLHTGEVVAWTGSSCGQHGHVIARVGHQWTACVDDTAALAVPLCCSDVGLPAASDKSPTTRSPNSINEQLLETKKAAASGGGGGGGMVAIVGASVGIGAIGAVIAVLGLRSRSRSRKNAADGQESEVEPSALGVRKLSNHGGLTGKRRLSNRRVSDKVAKAEVTAAKRVLVSAAGGLGHSRIARKATLRRESLGAVEEGVSLVITDENGNVEDRQEQVRRNSAGKLVESAVSALIERFSNRMGSRQNSRRTSNPDDAERLAARLDSTSGYDDIVKAFGQGNRLRSRQSTAGVPGRGSLFDHALSTQSNPMFEPDPESFA